MLKNLSYSVICWECTVRGWKRQNCHERFRNIQCAWNRYWITSNLNFMLPKKLNLLVLTGAKMPYRLEVFIYLRNHLHHHLEIFSICFLIWVVQENEKLENFAFHKFYWPHPFCKWVGIKLCLLIIYRNFITPFLTREWHITSWAATTPPKKWKQNMSFFLIFQ